MPDSEPPITKRTSDLPASQHYVDDAVASAIADVKAHFDKGVRTLLDELRENRRVMNLILEKTDAERDSRRRGLRIVKDDISRLEERVKGKLRKAAEALVGDESAGANGG